MCEEDRFYKQLEKMRVPFHVLIKLTYNCNFQCIHCYQTPQKLSRRQELSTEQWIRILDILKDRGVRSLTFTGGEIFTRGDFMKIYQYAYDRNFRITLLTNLSMLSDYDLNVLKERKPFRISMSLYGFSNHTYFLFAQNGVAFERVISNIKKLLAAKQNILVKVIVNHYNKAEIHKIVDFLSDKGVKWILFFNLLNYNDGSSRPKQVQVSLTEMAEFIDRYNLMKPLATMIRNGKEKPGGKCLVGINFGSIDPFGDMYLCEVCDANKWNVLEKGFDFCWEQLFAERQKYIDRPSLCDECEYRKYCFMCLPKIAYEYGTYVKPERACFRAKWLKAYMEGNRS